MAVVAREAGAGAVRGRQWKGGLSRESVPATCAVRNVDGLDYAAQAITCRACTCSQCGEGWGEVHVACNAPPTPAPASASAAVNKTFIKILYTQHVPPHTHTQHAPCDAAYAAPAATD